MDNRGNRADRRNDQRGQRANHRRSQ
jgi:hypothetical protein